MISLFILNVFGGSKYAGLIPKPIFFYVERNAENSEKETIVSLHFVDASTGEFRNLNFIASILTGLKMNEPTIGLTLNEKYKTGAEAIARLARRSVFARKDPSCITARKV